MAVSNDSLDEELRDIDLDISPSFSIEDEEEDQELQGWISCKSSSNDNTKKQIKYGLSVFKEFSERMNKNFEDIDNKALDVLLSNFYRAARNKKGELYSIKSMQAIRFGLQRHFLESRGVDIVRRDEFSLSHKTFKAMILKLRVHGKDKVRHHPLITEDDMARMQASLDLNTPQGLQYKAFLDTVLYFGNSSMKNLRSTRPGDFILHQESNQSFYTYGENQKVQMHAMPGNPRCPVANLKKYISKLNFNCQWMWQRPKQRYLDDPDTWYTDAPLGKYTLSSMTKTISALAGCYKGYTNHSLRTSMTKKMFEMSANGNKSHDGNYAITVITLPTTSNSIVAQVNKVNTARVPIPSATPTTGSSVNINMSQSATGPTSFKAIQPYTRKQDNIATSNMVGNKGTMTDLTWIELPRKLVQSKEASTQWEMQDNYLLTHSDTCTCTSSLEKNVLSRYPEITPVVEVDESMDSNESSDIDSADEATMLPTEAGSEDGAQKAHVDLTKEGGQNTTPIMRRIKREIVDEPEEVDYQTIYIKEEDLGDDCKEDGHASVQISTQQTSKQDGQSRLEMNSSRSTQPTQGDRGPGQQDDGHIMGSKKMTRLKFHITQGITKQVLTINSPTIAVSGAAIRRAVCNRLQALADGLLVQYFDEFWQDWVDIEPSMTLRGRTRLNVIQRSGKPVSYSQISTADGQKIHRLKYLLTLGESKQILTIESPNNVASGATVKEAVCSRLQGLADGLLVQYFDEDWQDWIDVEPSMMLGGRMRLNIIQTGHKSQLDPNR